MPCLRNKVEWEAGEELEKWGQWGLGRAPTGSLNEDFTLIEAGSPWRVVSREVTQFILLHFITSKTPLVLRPIIILCTAKREKKEPFKRWHKTFFILIIILILISEY